ncbi:unnamed protein product, partial [Durusdinium trenchii]
RYIRSRIVQRSSVEANAFWPFPEALSEAWESIPSRIFNSFQVLQLHAPGDATVQLTFREQPWYRVAVVGEHCVRVMVRRNCPAHALSTIFLVPRSSTLKSLATAITAAPHPDDHEMIVITQVFAMPGSDPSSAVKGPVKDERTLSDAPRQKTSRWSGCLRPLTKVPLGLNVPALNQWMECMMASHARKLSEDFYLVLALKKCASGSPLLLQHLEATVRNFNDWTRLSYEEFELTKYLQSLMDVINVNLRASCELDGRTLVPYMCAVPRKGWNENFAYIQGWLKMAGLAYKIHMGCSILFQTVRRAFSGGVLSGQK